jgi:GT2 family glycosyltransferase
LGWVSFVVLTRNSARTIGLVLESLTFPGGWLRDVVVVDGGSSDGTLGIVESFADRLPLSLLHDRGRGLGYARDIGWRATGAPYVVMLDSDVVLEPRFVSEGVRVMESDPGVGALGAKLRPVIIEKGWFAAFQAENLAIHLHLEEPCYPHSAVALHTACTMFRRSALERVGGFDHYFRLAKEDSDVSFRLRKAGYRLAYLPIEVKHLERARFWETNYRYGRSYVHIARKHCDMAPLSTPKNVLFTVALLQPALQPFIYLHYLRRYAGLKGRSLGRKSVLASIEVLRQALRTTGMLTELFRG